MAFFAFSKLSSTSLTSRKTDVVGAGANSNAFIFSLSRAICPCPRLTACSTTSPPASNASMIARAASNSRSRNASRPPR